MLRPRLLTAIFSSAPLVACTGSVSNPAGPVDAEAMTTTAVVIVERSVDVSAGTRAESSARFVRVPARSSMHEALRSIGAVVDLPAASACASIAALANGATAQVAPAIELADVGAVSLEANGHETHLVPRQLPDVTDIVSGVVYARAAEAAVFPASTRYVVHVAGNAEVDPFEVAATAPADPSDVRIAGDGPAGIVLTNGAPIELTWLSDASDDVLYVDVQPSAFRCTLSENAPGAGDRLHTTIPASLVDDAGTIVVHRVHRETLVPRGIESGEVRFDFARSVPYLRR